MVNQQLCYNHCGALAFTKEKMEIELLGKPGCHLCEEAKGTVERVCSRFSQRWEYVNIENDPLLFERYKEEIPVLLMNGKKLFKYCIDEKALEKIVRRRVLDSSQTLV